MNRQFTAIVKPYSIEFHEGRRKGAHHQWSYWVDGSQIDYYAAAESGGLSRIDRERAGVEIHHHVKNQGYNVKALMRAKRGHRKPPEDRTDTDGNTQKRLL